MPPDPDPIDDEIKNIPPEKFADELKRARGDAAKYRTKLREVEETVAQLKAAEDERKAKDAEAEQAEAAKRGEFERLANERKAELEAEKRSNAQKLRRINEARVEDALRAKLSAEGAIDADVVAKAIDRKGIAINEDTYEITGLDEVVAAFKEAKPTLFPGGEVKRPASGTNGNGRGPSGSTRTIPNVDFNDTTKSVDDLVGQFK